MLKIYNMKCLNCDGQGKWYNKDHTIWHICAMCGGTGKIGFFIYLWYKKILNKK